MPHGCSHVLQALALAHIEHTIRHVLIRFGQPEAHPHPSYVLARGATVCVTDFCCHMSARIAMPRKNPALCDLAYACSTGRPRPWRSRLRSSLHSSLRLRASLHCDRKYCNRFCQRAAEGSFTFARGKALALSGLKRCELHKLLPQKRNNKNPLCHTFIACISNHLRTCIFFTGIGS